MSTSRAPRRTAPAKSAGSPPATQSPGWTFLTNHSHVLLCIAREPSVRMREVALLVGVTERAVQRIVADLEAAGYLIRERIGRRNRYLVREGMPLRHAVERHEEISSLLALARDPPARGRR